MTFSDVISAVNDRCLTAKKKKIYAWKCNFFYFFFSMETFMLLFQFHLKFLITK